jgi:nucleotide-binding universal stress UspA family protein
MLHSILVPLDGSPFGEHALPWALSLAERAQIPIRLVHVHVPLAAVYAENRPGCESTFDARLRKSKHGYLEGVVQRLKAVTSVPVSSALSEGTVPEALQEFAIAMGASLVVMTTHGRGLFSRFWLGSVTDQFVRRTSVPTLLSHPREEAVNLRERPALPHVLIPLDGSPLGEQILEPALAFGSLMRADYTLLRVVEPLQFVGTVPVEYLNTLAGERDLERRKDEAQIYLDRLADRLRERSCRVAAHVVGGVQVAATILAQANDLVMSVIALQTHGRRGLSRLLLGSVADKVVRGATVPVLISRPNSK